MWAKTPQNMLYVRIVGWSVTTHPVGLTRPYKKGERLTMRLRIIDKKLLVIYDKDKEIFIGERSGSRFRMLANAMLELYFRKEKD